MRSILCFLLLTTIYCHSQNEVNDREKFKLELVVDQENNYAAEIPKSPYFVKEKILQIYPGEELNVEAEVQGDSIFSMKVVKQITHPEKTIRIKFLQNVGDRKNTQMILSVVNPFDQKLIYDARMFTVDRQVWESTSIIPIQPKLVNYETWPNVIATLALEKWRFVK